MANTLNEVKLIGNLGRDPVLSATPTGTVVVALSIGTTHSWKVGDKWEEETEWHRCVFYGPKAESISKRFRVGEKIYVSGRIKTRSWETPEGEKKTVREIICSDYVPMGNPSKDSTSHQSQSSTSRPVNTQANPPVARNVAQAQPAQSRNQSYDPYGDSSADWSAPPVDDGPPF